MTVAGYARISTDSQDNRVQLEMIKACVEENELVPDAGEMTIISDTVSGAVPFQKRPGGSRLWTTLKRGDTLVIQRLDRLGRTIFNINAVLNEFDERGVRVYVCRMPGGGGQLDTSTMQGRIITQVLCIFAELERELIRQRIAEGKDRAVREGRAVGACPFGYKDVMRMQDGKEVKMRVINDAEQEIIDRILYLKDKGYTGMEVYRDMTQCKDKSKRYKNPRSPSGFLGYQTVLRIYNKGRKDETPGVDDKS